MKSENMSASTHSIIQKSIHQTTIEYDIFTISSVSIGQVLISQVMVHSSPQGTIRRRFLNGGSRPAPSHEIEMPSRQVILFSKPEDFYLTRNSITFPINNVFVLV